MKASDWAERSCWWLLRLSLAIVFIWFGLLKLLDQCPLGAFIGRTVAFLPERPFLCALGCWEIAIGLCLVFPGLLRLGLWLLLAHLPGTVLPFAVLPGECFTQLPLGLTVAGQYIVKNLVLGSAALVLLARTRQPALNPNARTPRMAHRVPRNAGWLGSPERARLPRCLQPRRGGSQ